MALARPEIRLPDQPALTVGFSSCTWLRPTGEIETIDIRTARRRISHSTIPIVCHARSTARRLSLSPFLTLDILELFAFVNPAQFALPTPLGMAEALGLALPNSQESATETLFSAAHSLLAELAKPDIPNDENLAFAAAMCAAGWPWGPSVLAALGKPEGAYSSPSRLSMKIWTKLPEWQDAPPRQLPNDKIVSPLDSLNRLVELLGNGAERRQGQIDFTKTCTAAFQPLKPSGGPHIVLAEAGTGVGKTLGYLAPASLWAERNEGAVWVSTFTRNLQRQLDAELDRLCPTPLEKESRIVIRKGRENYLCLLNLADAINRQPARGGNDVIGLGLVSRWASATRDGDMIGGDFPAWLIDILGTRLTVDMTDKSGECIYSACDHYKKCFIERTIRRADTADIVVANHALVMTQAAAGNREEGTLPLRYVFDEGHHLFDVADGAFSVHLSGSKTADLRRWILGLDSGRSGTRRRRRGLHDRASDIISGNNQAEKFVAEILRAAQALPGNGWRKRICDGEPIGPTERFLRIVHQQVYARDRNAKGPYDIETEIEPSLEGLIEAAKDLEDSLMLLEKPLKELNKWLMRRLETEAQDIDSATRARIYGFSKSIAGRCSEHLLAWRAMLNALDGERSDFFIDWFGVSRTEGQDVDVGYYRHYLDPTKPLAESVFEQAQGILVTSASLGAHGLEDTDDYWASAQVRVGVNHISSKPVRASHPSPFKYIKNTRVLIIGDVDRNNLDHVAAAYRELFIASGGGGLGLFTAISRLLSIHERIAGPLEAANLSLLAQHVDPLDTGTLIDIFRAEENSCLLGTDAVRDGIDVPGRSLRLIVFDRVPWPRPTILNKARRNAFGGQTYDDMLTRRKLKQAYGRLLRRQGDKGILVMLDRSLPTRLLSAFPSGVESKRMGLADALKNIRAFID